MKPFSLRLFVADGDPDGLRVNKRSYWVGKAIQSAIRYSRIANPSDLKNDSA
jgi:hypothetical protein